MGFRKMGFRSPLYFLKAKIFVSRSSALHTQAKFEMLGL